MKVVPTSFECYDGLNELVFTVKAMDESCASVSIDTIVTSESWTGISKMIANCLDAMELEP